VETEKNRKLKTKDIFDMDSVKKCNERYIFKDIDE
jgi:hypothetical protein